MKWKLSLPESPVFLYYLLKLFGLAPITVKNNKFYPPTFPAKLYSVFVATGYSLFMAMTVTPTMRKFYAENYSLFLKIWGTILYLMSLPCILFTVTTFLMMHKKIVYLMNTMCTISDDLKILGIKENHRKFVKNIFVTSVTGNVVLIAACVILFLLEPQWYIFTSIKFCIDSWFSFNMVLVFAQILMCIRQRFILVNEELCDLLIPSFHLRSSHHARIFTVNVNTREEDEPGSEDLTVRQRIWKIETLHLELCDLVDRTTDLFATPIFLNSLRLSSQLVISSYWLYVVFQNAAETKVIHILCSSMRLAIVMVELFIVANASAKVCQQGNATKTVLFKVWIKLRPRELASVFFTFSNQLLHTPVTVCALGFMNLDYSFLFTLFCTLVTYFVVMLQLETTEPYIR